MKLSRQLLKATLITLITALLLTPSLTTADSLPSPLPTLKSAAPKRQRTMLQPITCYSVAGDGQGNDLSPLPLAEWDIPSDTQQCPRSIFVSYLLFPGFYRFDLDSYFYGSSEKSCKYSNYFTELLAIDERQEVRLDKNKVFCFIQIRRELPEP